MEIPVIFRNDKLPKLTKQLLRTKLIATFKVALPKVILSLFLLSVHLAQNFVSAINNFSPSLKKIDQLSHHIFQFIV